MINLLDNKVKTKIFNFLGLTKTIILKDNYMVIKTFSLNGIKNIKKFIEEKLEGQLGEIEELLIHYEILKINKEKQLIIYIVKDDNVLEKALRENLKVKLKIIQIEKAKMLKKKLKIKSGIIILKEENIFYSLSFAKGVLVNYDELSFLEDISIVYYKELLEKIIRDKINSIYVSEEVLKYKKKEIEDLNLTILGV